MATQTKTFKISWMGQYRESSNTYYGSGSPIRTGSSYNYNSYLGFPSALRDALNSSKVTPTMKLKINVTNASDVEWDLGRHKETYDKGSGTMPWYNYLQTYQGAYVGVTGWLTFDLTNNFMNDYKAGTYQGIVLYSGTSDYAEAYGVTGDSNCAYIEVTGDWNSPPNNPTITYPKGGEVVENNLTITWTNNGDPDGDPVKFQTAIWDGSAWTYGSETAFGATSYTWDMSQFKETSSAMVAVRAGDGTDWSPYVHSNNFTITHNLAPTAPTQLSPSSGSVVDRTALTRFSWKHNDDGAQAGFKLQWRTVASDGTRGAWNPIPASGFMNTTNQYYDMPANTFPASDIEWEVMTQDQSNLSSPWSSPVVFTASTPSTAPTITTPSGSSWGSSNLTVEWSSLDQQQYEVDLMDSTGVTTLWSQTGSGATKLVYPVYTLANNTSYIVKVRIKDSSGVWSPYSSRTITTAFTPPTAPTIDSWEEAGSGVVNLHYSSTDAKVTSLDLYRREYTPTDTAPWVLIGKDLAPAGASFLEYTLASGTVYEFKLTAKANDNTSSDSAITQLSINFTDTFIQEASNLSSIALLKYSLSREGSFKVDSNLMKFAGRPQPVREFGEGEDVSVTVSWEVDSYVDVTMFRDILRKRDTLLYRDGNGRRFWVTADEISVKDKEVEGFTLSCEFTVTSYTEDLV